MSLGLATFHLTPQTFWALSLPEWRALVTPPPRAMPLARSEFEQLMLQHPD
ncbi:MAG TPA: phage tail assembly chaperone [Rhizomicrobium sp.]|nr:phage tail assembly chaperone [Rhizomicrobium sp.]